MDATMRNMKGFSGATKSLQSRLTRTTSREGTGEQPSNGRSDKKDREAEKNKGSEKEEASNKVSLQSLNMSCDKVDQITAKKSDQSVCE